MAGRPHPIVQHDGGHLLSESKHPLTVEQAGHLRHCAGVSRPRVGLYPKD